MDAQSPAREVEQIRTAEIARIAGAIVDLRAERAHWAIAPCLVIFSLRPTLARGALLGLALLALFVVARRERGRFRRAGYSPRFVAETSMVTAGIQAVVYLTTGALGSPLLPVLLVFTFAVSSLLGPHPGRLVFVAFQLGVLALMALAQALGLADLLAPAWLTPQSGLGHAITVFIVLAALTVQASRMGDRTHELFNDVVARVSNARQDLLRTQVEQSEQLTALTGAIAHELKNPLASVKGLGGLLARDVPDGKAAERLVVLRREVDRMQGILEEFLNFSRPVVPLHHEPLDLAALGADVLALHEGQAREAGVRLVLEGEGSANGDGRKTRQILINLVQNAIEASAGGGTVSLRVGPGAVRVDDEGAGLDNAVSARVFEAGVTTKPRGSGLGLTIARGLARQQGGELSLESLPGRGARASLRLPTEATA